MPEIEISKEIKDANYDHKSKRRLSLPDLSGVYETEVGPLEIDLSEVGPLRSSQQIVLTAEVLGGQVTIPLNRLGEGRVRLVEDPKPANWLERFMLRFSEKYHIEQVMVRVASAIRPLEYP